ncbi:MAG: hypothetical protein AAGL10_05770 [Pseudomonadota bacterium]
MSYRDNIEDGLQRHGAPQDDFCLKEAFSIVERAADPDRLSQLLSKARRDYSDAKRS